MYGIRESSLESGFSSALKNCQKDDNSTFAFGPACDIFEFHDGWNEAFTKAVAFRLLSHNPGDGRTDNAIANTEGKPKYRWTDRNVSTGLRSPTERWKCLGCFPQFAESVRLLPFSLAPRFPAPSGRCGKCPVNQGFFSSGCVEQRWQTRYPFPVPDCCTVSGTRRRSSQR